MKIQIRVCIAAFCALALSGCASKLSKDYAGSDAGHVVIGLGALQDSPYSPIVLKFRRIGDTAEGRFVYFKTPVALLSRDPDYKSTDEAGVVETASLPPGNYEAFNFEATIDLGTARNVFFARAPFSIPFEIRPNEVVYLGNFQVNPIREKSGPFGRVVGLGPFFAPVSARALGPASHAADRCWRSSAGALRATRLRPAFFAT